MPDPLADASAGSPSPFINKLDTVNAVLEAARRERARRNDLAGENGRDVLTPACRVLVRNDTGGTLPAFSVLALGTPIISAVDYPYDVRRDPLFPGTAPAAETDVFAITIEPLTYGDTGRAVVMGTAVCDISVSDATHTFAVPAVATTATLASAMDGPARIIWKETGTGTKRAVILLGPPSAATTGGGFFARLTTSSVGLWKWVALTTSSGAAVDDGSESATYNARPLQIDGSNLSNPVAGMRVMMKPSKEAGYYEFIPIGFASTSYPGLVSITTQSLVGVKTWTNDALFQGNVTVDSAASNDFGLYVKGLGTSNKNPENVILCGNDGTRLSPYVAIGNCYVSNSAYDDAALLVPKFNTPYPTTPGYGVPLSVSGPISTPILRVYSSDDAGAFNSFAWLGASLDPLAPADGMAIFSINGRDEWPSVSETASVYTCLSSTWVRVPPAGTFRVSKAYGEDYVGVTTVKTINSEDYHFKGGILVGVTAVGEPAPYTT